MVSRVECSMCIIQWIGYVGIKRGQGRIWVPTYRRLSMSVFGVGSMWGGRYGRLLVHVYKRNTKHKGNV